METTYAYDLASRKTEEVQDAGTGGLQIKVTWKYDQWDGTNEVYYDVVEAWEDGSTHQDTKYVYGAAKHPGAVTVTTYPDSGDVTVTYNDDGTVATRTDQRSWTVTYTYDDAKRVTAEAVTGTGLVGTTAVTYAYDALGRPTSVTDNNDPSDGNDNSTVSWTYTREADGDLKVEEEQAYGTMTDRTVTYTYDLSGRLKTMQYPSAMTLTYGYDDLGRPVAVNDGTDDRVEDTWKGHLLEKREYANGTYLTHLDDSSGNLSGYGYDAFGRIKNHRWKSSGGTLLAGWSHDYDRIGNKKYQEDLQDATESELYGYDDVYRLTSFERGQLNANKDDIASPSRTQTWTLDPLGNWDSTAVDGTTETRVHNSVNELTSRTIGQDPVISLTYDDAGNLIQDGSADGDHKYVWDYRNRLLEVEERQSGTWNTVGEYRYDAHNRRVLKVVTNSGDLNGTTRFLWGGDSDWQCLEERAGDGALMARYTYAPGYVDAVAVQERDLNSDDDFADTNEVVYYHSSTLFSVYALSDASESVVERYRYDAYGACTVLDADGSADADGLSDVENPYAFTGRRLELESGLMQYRNRYYHTAIGRFVSRDPVGGVSPYVYADCRPQVLGDPTGNVAVEFQIGEATLRYEVDDDKLRKAFAAHADGFGAVRADRYGYVPCFRAQGLRFTAKLFKAATVLRWQREDILPPEEAEELGVTPLPPDLRYYYHVVAETSTEGAACAEAEIPITIQAIDACDGLEDVRPMGVALVGFSGMDLFPPVHFDVEFGGLGTPPAPDEWEEETCGTALQTECGAKRFEHYTITLSVAGDYFGMFEGKRPSGEADTTFGDPRLE
jgi:RHS repeat-associated protein